MELRKKTRNILFYVVLIAICTILFFPLYWMIVSSLIDRGSLLNATSIIPSFKSLTLEAYNTIITKKPIFKWFLNSTVVALFTIFISMIVATLAAYSLSRFKSVINNSMGFLLLLVRMLPETLLIIPLYVIFIRIGLIDNHISLIISNIAFIVPFSTWMMKGFFDGIPTSLEEAAMIDGCTLLQSVTKVVLPLTKPGLAATGIYSAVLTWSEFLFARTFMTKPEFWTITVGIQSLIGEHVVLWGEIMAAAVIGILPILILFIFMQKYIVSGMTSGAVKQ